MSTTGTTTFGRRWRALALAGSLATGLLVAPGLAGAGSGTGQPGRGSVEATAAEDLNLQRSWVEFFNGRNWDELGAIYEEDAVAIPPNSKPIQGRAAIIEHFKGLRETLGEVTCGEPARVTASGDLVALVADDCSVHSGTVRFNAHELYARQPDGSLRYRFDMFGAQ